MNFNTPSFSSLYWKLGNKTSSGLKMTKLSSLKESSMGVIYLWPSEYLTIVLKKISGILFCLRDGIQAAKIPRASWPKNPKHKTEAILWQNQIKTLKMVHIKKKNLQKKKKKKEVDSEAT